MNPAQVQYIRDRLTDWEAVPEACQAAVDLFHTESRVVMTDVRTPENRVLWSTDDLVRTARHLRVLVDACEASLSKPPGDADRAWAIAFLGSLALIWSDRPDYPKAAARHAD